MTRASSGPGDGTESDDVSPPTGYDAGSRRWMLLSIGISLTALAALVIHLVWPHLATDTLTLGLLFIAFVPWLAPLVTKLKLPGGAEVEFRQIRRDIARLSDRVDTVAQWALDSAIPANVQQSMSAALTGYRAYLDGIPLPRSGALPQIYSYPEAENKSLYLKEVNSILLGGVYADDPDMVLHEYTHVALQARRPGWPQTLMPVESGLAGYLPCSFYDRPYLGGRTHVTAFSRDLSANAGILLENDLRMDFEDDTETKQNLGLAWGAAFWEIRCLLGKDTTDRLVVDAWADEQTTSADSFVEQLMRRINDDSQLVESVDGVREILIKRGATLP